MVEEKDLAAINQAIEDGYEIRIRKTADGVKIVAEKVKAKILKSGKRPFEATIK